MNRQVMPGIAAGTVAAPPSKSMAHRYLIGAALAAGKSVLHGIPEPMSQDLLATADCLTAMGAALTRCGRDIMISGMPEQMPAQMTLPCRECGTTLRLLLPLCLRGGRATLTGSRKLLSRPLSVYESICREQGILYQATPDAVTVEGILTAGDYRLPGNVSSQFVSGFLYALPRLAGDSTVTLTTTVESRSYIDLTLRVLAAFGVRTEWRGEQTIFVPGGQVYHPVEATVEGDWSNAAFWLALEALGDRVTVTGLREDSLQGDKVCRAAFAAMREGCPTVSVADCPDLAPVLITVAALCHGATLTDTARLRLKESDRGEAMREELFKCGVNLVVEENRILIPPSRPLPPQKTLSGHNDHRIVMALAVLLSRLGGTITGTDAVQKSYPDFFGELNRLGIVCDETI